ncbi:unnamed protein product [Durusdinium trenchii]|uniref:Uncharacterized protein n=1 Tax=Durusdinium trenchii TaxID=1381693 RepID=A0ABP0P3R8_9DINO
MSKPAMREAERAKAELRQRTIKELKEMLSQEGYNPDDIVGVEKDELVDKLWVLRQNPVEEDPYPLPLYSNCWPQFILRAIFLAAMHWFVVSSFAVSSSAQLTTCSDAVVLFVWSTNVELIGCLTG